MLFRSQIPSDSDIESVRIKLAYDLYYLRHLGFLFDAMIYLGTFLKLIGLSFAAIRSLCRFPQREIVAGEYQSLAHQKPHPRAASRSR